MAKVLIVDDSIAIRQQLKMSLLGLGHDVQEAENGLQGLESAKKVQFEVIIVDMNMPVMNGMEMVDSIRRLEAYRNTPIFMLTTQAGKEIAKKGKEIGVTAWMVKPFKTDMLRKGLQRVLAA